MTETPTKNPTAAPFVAPTTGKVCPRCAKLYDPCEPWRCGCTACGNLLVWATRAAIARASYHRKLEGWRGDRRTRNRVPL